MKVSLHLNACSSGNLSTIFSGVREAGNIELFYTELVVYHFLIPLFMMIQSRRYILVFR